MRHLDVPRKTAHPSTPANGDRDAIGEVRETTAAARCAAARPASRGRLTHDVG